MREELENGPNPPDMYLTARGPGFDPWCTFIKLHVLTHAVGWTQADPNKDGFNGHLA